MCVELSRPVSIDRSCAFPSFDKYIWFGPSRGLFQRTVHGVEMPQPLGFWSLLITMDPEVRMSNLSSIRRPTDFWFLEVWTRSQQGYYLAIQQGVEPPIRNCAVCRAFLSAFLSLCSSIIPSPIVDLSIAQRPVV